MKVPSELPELAALRSWCGRFCPSETPANQWTQVRPGRVRLVNRTSAGRWIYGGAEIQTGEFRPVKEINALTDKQSLRELGEQVAAALKQILYRAFSGDEKAIAEFAQLARKAVASLEILTGSQKEKVKRQAETFARWPVLMSLNPQDSKWGQGYLASLGVGTRASTPLYPRQRLDPRSFWTTLAAKAFSACQKNRSLVPWLEAHGKKARKRTHGAKNCWRTPVRATFYTLHDNSIIIVADWQKRCVKLVEHVTEDNFEDWWAVVKPCVLQHWQTIREEYEKALNRIGRATEDESRRRNLAMTELRQAFRSLVGLR